MRLTWSLASSLFLSMPLITQQPTSPTTLAALRDRFRPLLIFAAAPDDPALQAQLHMLKDSTAGLTERDVLVIAIPYNNPAPTPVALTPADALAARHRFHVDPAEFTVLLLGKDGGEKLRSRKPLSFTKLQETIDTMPMRQQEMQEGRSPHE